MGFIFSVHVLEIITQMYFDDNSNMLRFAAAIYSYHKNLNTALDHIKNNMNKLSKFFGDRHLTISPETN